jgi:hypothetical protein
MLRHLALFISTVVFSGALGTAANAGCVLFNGPNYSGQSLAMVAGFPLGSLRQAFDRKVASVRVLKGCRLAVYAAPNFEGETDTIAENRSTLTQSWSNRIDSVRCDCKGKGEACILFERSGLSGAQLTVARGGDLKDVGSAWKDRVGSLFVPHGCALVGYDGSGFRGERRTFSPGEHKSLAVNWDSRIASAACKCGDD